jgi:hypothetical protein
MKFMQFVKSEFEDLLADNNQNFCERSARTWLNELGFLVSEQSKGMYIDGHERLDVQIYRGKFLDRMFNSYFPRMPTYDGEKMERIPPTLKPGEKELILINHDECIWHSNDTHKYVRLQKDEHNLIPKGQGRGSFPGF